MKADDTPNAPGTSGSPATPDGTLPSSRALLRSTAIAIVSAAVILVTVVLPAEYGIDPTRIGSVIGLTRMGEIKARLAKEAAANDSADAAAAAAADREDSVATATTAIATATATVPAAIATAPGTSTNSHVERVELKAGEGKEIKLDMRKGARATFAWSTDRGVVNYDLHGDTLNAPDGDFHSYRKGVAVRADSGEIVAAFDGRHGWYWRNRTAEPLVVTLTTRGDYQSLRYVK
ncbi:MAG: transmembrane anchor protein [Gemmatimonadetes bacterium]|nr:transmembrane anchor protein [Gemmatimonadota bacterium]